MIKEKKDALRALEECDEFYLTVVTKGRKAGYWNFEDYTTLIGTLSVAVDWFKREVFKSFK